MDCLPLGKIVKSTKTGYHISIDKFFYIHPNVMDVFIKQLLDNLPCPVSNIDLIVSCWFERHVNKLNPTINALINCNFNTITVVIDTWQKDHYTLTTPVICINQMLLYSELHADFEFATNIARPIRRPVGLLLTGKLGKFNRIRLLQELYNRKLLLSDNIIWSAPEWRKQYNNIKNIPMIKDLLITDDFLDYCEVHAYNFDNASHWFPAANCPLISIHQSSICCYEISDYSIITETYFVEDEPSVTEKTYRAILNKHPFIIAGSAGTLQYLKNIGIRTFENYLPISEYDSIVDPDLRITAIVDNIAAFPDILIKFKDDIAVDVEYNYNILKNIAQTDRHILEKLYYKYNLSLDELNKKFSLMGHFSEDQTIDEFEKFIQEVNCVTEKVRDEYWLAKYNQCKGAGWPELNSRDEFNLLPESIQQECINDFNFDATTQIF